MNMNAPITIVLGDDHTIVLKGLRAFLEGQPGFSILGEAQDGLKLTSLTERLKPDVLVADLMMPGLNGFDVTRRVVKRFPKTKVVILSMYSTEAHVVEALRSGASAYVLKDARPEELVSAIRGAAREPGGRRARGSGTAGRVRGDPGGNLRGPGRGRNPRARRREVLRGRDRCLRRRPRGAERAGQARPARQDGARGGAAPGAAPRKHPAPAPGALHQGGGAGGRGRHARRAQSRLRHPAPFRPGRAARDPPARPAPHGRTPPPSHRLLLPLAC